MTVTVGIAGLGLIGKERLLAVEKLQSRGRDIEVAGVFDPYADSSLGGDYRVETLPALLSSQPDLVVVATPHSSALEVATAALSSGSDVLVEKPLGRSAAETTEFAEMSALTGRSVHVGFNYRFFPGVRALLADLDKQAFGDLINVRMTLGHGGSPGDEKTWKLDGEHAGGGCLIDPGIHLIDLAQQIGGECAVSSTNTWSGFWGTGIEEQAHVVLEARSVPMIDLDISIVRWRSTFRLEVNGTEGYGLVEGRGRSYGPQTYRTGRRWGWKDGGTQAESERVVLSSDCSDSFADELEDLLFGPSESGGVCTLAQARSGMDTLESCRMHAGISR